MVPRGFTEGSALRDAAGLLEEVEKVSSPAVYDVDDLVRRIALYSRAVRTVSGLIRRELSHLDWVYSTGVSECMTDAAGIIACQRGWESGFEDGGSVATDPDLIRVLLQPMPPAAFIAVLCDTLDVETPALVIEALNALPQPNA